MSQARPGPRRTPGCGAARRISTVNGAPGLVFEETGQVVGVMAFTVAGHRITEIDFVVNPEKLRRVALTSDQDGG